MFNWLSELSFLKKIAVTITVFIACAIAMYNVGVSINDHWVLYVVYAADQQQFTQRLDTTDLTILEGQMRNTKFQIYQLESKKTPLTPSEQVYLNSLKNDADILNDKISAYRRKVNK